MKHSGLPIGRSHRRALTLFELAIVLVILVILAALVIYSTQSFIIQTKSSRVREDQRTIMRALQNYAMDHGHFPTAQEGLEALLRPTAYLGELPNDPFQGPGYTYLYITPNLPSMGCVLISPGPDGQFDLPGELWEFASVQNVDQRLLPSRLTPVGLRSGASMVTGPIYERNPTPYSEPSRMTEAQLAILSTYIKLGQYDAARGESGDIITILR